jgi:hypothetical protein
MRIHSGARPWIQVSRLGEPRERNSWQKNNVERGRIRHQRGALFRATWLPRPIPRHLEFRRFGSNSIFLYYCYADGNFWSWRLVRFDSCSPPSRKTFRHVVGRRTTRCIGSATGAGEPVQCGRIFSRSSCAHPSLSGTIKYGTSVIFLSFHWPFCLDVFIIYAGCDQKGLAVENRLGLHVADTASCIAVKMNYVIVNELLDPRDTRTQIVSGRRVWR